MLKASKIISLLLCAILVGCATTEPVIKIQTVEVKVPVPVFCKTEDPKKPSLLFSTIRDEDDIFSKVKILLHDKLQYESYITDLEAAFKSCK